MNNTDILLKELIQEIRGMREDLALTLALKRKQLSGKSEKYLKFEEWAEEKKEIETPDITSKFHICKHTAIDWMNKFVYEHKDENWRIIKAWAQDPQRAWKKIVKKM